MRKREAAGMRARHSDGFVCESAISPNAHVSGGNPVANKAVGLSTARRVDDFPCELLPEVLPERQRRTPPAEVWDTCF
jgi:hypothetical protein